MDMDGDAKPDFLVTRTCSSLAGADPDVGELKWLVYNNTGTGFATAPSAWPLPQDYANGFCSSPQGDTYCDSYNGYGRPAYSTFDLNGDARPDFVVSKTCSTLAGADPDVGKLYWRLYANTGTGFAASPANWSLPQGYAKGFYNKPAGDTYCDSYNGYGRPAYATVDLDDDLRPDFVVLDTCSSLQGSDPAVGSAYWLLYENNGTGFSAVAKQWCLPQGYAKGFYHALSGDTYCDSYNGYGRPAYATFSLTGSGRDDFVVTKTCSTLLGSDPDVSVTKWVVY